MSNTNQQPVTILGAGNLGQAIAHGLVRAELYTAADVVLTRRHASRLADMAEQGFAVAQNNLGAMYVNGLGVPLDHEEAMRWFVMAAEQGFAEAQYTLGLIHRGLMNLGGLDIELDSPEDAMRWYLMAAEQGHIEAQFDLGWAYANGEGVTQDYAEAYAWFSAASAQGRDDAEETLQALLRDMTPSQAERAEILAREYQEKFLTR